MSSSTSLYVAPLNKETLTLAATLRFHTVTMDTSLSNESSSSQPTHHTASAPSRQPAELPSYAQLGGNLDQTQCSLISQTTDVRDLVSGSAGGKRITPSHPSEPPAKNLHEDVVIVYSKQKERLSNVVIVKKLQAIPKATANAACESLDKEVARIKEEGALEAGKSSMVKLEWTVQTQEVVRIYENVCANLESNSQSLD